MHNKVDLTLKELSLSATTQHVPGNTGTLSLRGKKLVCVEYPALVQNLDRVLESLGGEQTVSKVSNITFEVSCQANMLTFSI